uniref:exocyst complex component EXO84A-like n=1 Tax=Erigeron canadensis TaxID=72917 RepID=UPI001CB986AC|nr:exocyst complex component EXO84A-like [Erigeron canadensis]
METTTTSPPSNFRFRDHGPDMDNGESVVGDTSSELSSVTSDDEESDIESGELLASMTAKGINHLCLELNELKQASQVDFQDNIISNYASFIRVFRETEGINNEVMQLKYHIMAQKQLVRNLTDDVDLQTVLDDNRMDRVLDESTIDDQNPTVFFKACVDEVLETLDNLLFEHRLEEALDIFETEDGDSPKVKFHEDIPPDVWMAYKSDMAERRVMLADKLTLVADNPRVSAAELQKSLGGLSRLGFDHLATRLLLKYYHTRIASGVKNLQSSTGYLPGLYVHDLAKLNFSLISQAARSFVMLYGETSPYDSELMKWACEETEAFAGCFNRHIKSMSQIGGGLSTLVDTLHFATSYCSMLKSQKLVLLPCLIEHILPSVEGILKAHFDHFKKVISIFTSSDVWVMGRYLVSSMFTEGTTSTLFSQQPEYCLLTNSGRKFVSLLQTVIEEVSSLVPIFGTSILNELMEIFMEYSSILERALAYETNDAEEGAPRIKMAESLSQKVSIIANLSTLEHFFSSVIRNLFKGVNHLKIVMDGSMISIADACSKLRTHICKQFIRQIMSNEDTSIRDHIDSDLFQGLMPSPPYQILFLELRKVEELTEDSVNEFDWLASLLTELVETAFDWILRDRETWVTCYNDETTDKQSDRLTQFSLDMQFLVEIARRGGYLTTNMINSSTDLVSKMESAIVSKGFDLNRCVVDYKKVANSAIEAIKQLEALEEQKWRSGIDIHKFDDNSSEEYQPHFSSNSIEDVDTQSCSEVSFGTADLSDEETNPLELSDHEAEVRNREDCGVNGSKEIISDKMAKLPSSEMTNTKDLDDNILVKDEADIEDSIVEPEHFA